MSEKLPLTGETIIFTGSKEPEGAMALTASLGGEAIYLPLIEHPSGSHNCRISTVTAG
ncbi:hypothetical protein [Planococcus koreensis]|uniref:hypothetical protein n=1 Tax=Planococcus koreensis TaxID=112331 RepID=UPI0039FBD9CC